MLNLDAEKQRLEPWWFTVQAAIGDLPAVEVHFVPIGRVALRNARRAAASAIGSGLPDDDDAPLPNELVEQAGDILSESLLMAGIDDWRGVGDGDGNPVTVTPERLAIFLADPIRFERLDEAYVRPFVMKELEKNGSSPLPNGISAGATQEVDIANRSARRSVTAGAKRTRKKGARKAAPIAKTNCAPTPGSPSGT
ncbi:hypothetical protein CJD35_11430 [Sphingobium xenophagum]|uniref:Uncharacterized protein n=1 Tax=Sphingobium xenophagum TaxID=121428 RepID=A0A249MUL7_SPHXE|nr:hypothetical protein [Sphingobium xenophagum]ASY44982.1 hypothetical protein CJD35_11430 [Sphingobium xenophagum]